MEKYYRAGQYSASQLDFGVQVVAPLKTMLANVLSFIPLVVAALGILLIGWGVAVLVRLVMRKFLKSIHFDQLAEHTGITEVLNEQKVGMSPSLWVSQVLYWFGIFMSWIIALDMVRLQIPSVMLIEVGNLLSRIFIGFFVFLVGLFLSVVVSKFVETTAKRLEVGHPALQAGIIRWAMILFTFMITLSHFGFPGDYILIVLAAVGLTLCVTFAIAFGVGGIAWAPKILDKITKTK